MFKSKFSFILSILLLVFAVGCGEEDDNLNDDDIVDTCETENISYASKVSVILQENQCISCHNATSAQGGIVLDDYNTLKNVVDGGRLLGSIKHESGFSAMPQGGAKIAQCDIDQIEAWINDGALNN